MVLQHGLAVYQQAADQGALAVIHRAAGNELQRRFQVILACSPFWLCASSYQISSVGTCSHLSLKNGGKVFISGGRGSGCAGPQAPPPGGSRRSLPGGELKIPVFLALFHGGIGGLVVHAC